MTSYARALAELLTMLRRLPLQTMAPRVHGSCRFTARKVFRTCTSIYSGKRRYRKVHLLVFERI